MSDYYPGPPPMESDEAEFVRDPGPMGSEDSAEPVLRPGPGQGAGSDLPGDATQRDTEGGSSASADASGAEDPGAGPGAGVPAGSAHAAAAAPAGATAPRPIAPKEYYSISEVCELVGLKPHVLRYWESQFPVLNPSKNRSGNRVYQRKEIKLVLLVQHLLYKEKYTIEGARQRLDQLRRGGKGGELAQATSSAVSAEMRKLLRDELTQLLEVLSPRATDGGTAPSAAPDSPEPGTTRGRAPE